MDFDPTPERIGPGAWNTMHNTAAGADEMDSVQGRDFFASFISNMLTRFPCQKCRNHALSYLARNHPSVFVQQNPALAYPLSRWTMDFHNFVNARLKKSLWDWATYRSVYIDNTASGPGMICKGGCDD